LPPTIPAFFRCDSPRAAFAGRSSGGCYSQAQILPFSAGLVDSLDHDLNWVRYAAPGLAPGPPL